MAFTVSVRFDTQGILEGLEERFGIGSDAQREWSRIVFDGSSDYVPFRTGRFEEHSREVSTPLFEQGELLYQSPPELGYDYLPMQLWTGSSRHGAIIIKNYTTSTHALAGGRWTERAKNDLLPIWTQQFQDKINAGEV